MSKEKQMFGPQHFPIGTVFEVYLPQIMQEPAVYETSGVFKNGPRSYVVQTTHYDKEITVYKSFNVCHIKRILKRGKGTTMYDNGSQYIWNKHAGCSKNVCNEIPISVRSNKKKHVQSTNWADIILSVIPEDMVTNDMLIDKALLKDLLIKVGALRIQYLENDACYGHIYTGNKKQMKKVARRVLTKCLLNHRKEEEKEDTEWESNFG